MDGFYRTHMFKECHKCGKGGLQCTEEYATLKSGYWWKWRNETRKHHYKEFIKNLLSSSPALDASSVQYPHPIPTPYKCPVEQACKGGLDSPCSIGYRGPLCAVCSSGYYKQLQTCKQCPSKEWMVGQLSIILVVFIMVIALLLWTGKKNMKKTTGLNLMDMFLSKLKIVIGFYQVTYGLMDAFSFIKWPDSLQIVAKYSQILQLDILQIAPIHCLLPGLHVDAFGSLFAMMVLNAAVISLFGIAYGVRKVSIITSYNLDAEEKARKMSQTKEFVYRNLFFFLYVTYLSTCSKTANVLPPACRKLCRDRSSIGDGGFDAFLRNCAQTEPSLYYVSVEWSVEWSEQWIQPLGALNLQARSEPVVWCLLILHKRTCSFVQ